MSEPDYVADEIEDLLAVEHGLTPWEVDFLDDMDGRERFTAKQAEKVHQIWDRLCG